MSIAYVKCSYLTQGNEFTENMKNQSDIFTSGDCPAGNHIAHLEIDSS